MCFDLPWLCAPLLFDCAQRGVKITSLSLVHGKPGTGPLIIRFQGVTSTQDYKNILVYSSKEHGGMKVTDLRLNENAPRAFRISHKWFLSWIKVIFEPLSKVIKPRMYFMDLLQKFSIVKWLM